jgi:hypothetical protein
MHSTCSSCLILLGVTILIIHAEEYTLWSSHYAAFPNLLPHHLSTVHMFSARCSQIPSVCVLPLLYSKAISFSVD